MLEHARRGTMKYALLVFGDERLDTLASEDKRRFHRAHRELHNDLQAATAPAVTVLAHFRTRPPEQTTTIRLLEDKAATIPGPAIGESGTLRALYLLQSDDPDAVADFAARFPAIRLGGSVEIWPLIEPKPAPPAPQSPA